jgi:hypothetical protein
MLYQIKISQLGSFKQMVAWINHLFMNLGASLACIWYAILPPQITKHSAEDLEKLSKSNPIKSFISGLLGN